MSDKEGQSVEHLDPLTEKAIARGWRPKEEWEGASEEWVDAEEFNRRGELMDTISQLNKKDKAKDERIDRLEAALKELGDHNRKIAEKEYERAITNLKRQKIQALENDDHQAVVELEDRLDKAKEAKRKFDESANFEEKAPQQKLQPQLNPLVEQWKAENTWYKTNTAMRGAADAFAADYMQHNPGSAQDVEAVLNYVDRKMQEEFPDKGIKRRPSGSVDTNGASGRGDQRGKGKFSPRHLNASQRSIGETLVKAGAFEKLQDYVDQLAELGELS